MRLRSSGLPQNHSRLRFLKRSAQCISTPRDGTTSVTHEVLVRARHSETPETLRPQARVSTRCPSRFGVILMQRFAAILVFGGPTPGRMNCPF
jgi:hypothetical protein